MQVKIHLLLQAGDTCLIWVSWHCYRVSSRPWKTWMTQNLISDLKKPEFCLIWSKWPWKLRKSSPRDSHFIQFYPFDACTHATTRATSLMHVKKVRNTYCWDIGIKKMKISDIKLNSFFFFFRDMFIYSVSNADISKKCKIWFFCIISFSKIFGTWKLLKTCDHAVVPPSMFFKENFLYDRLKTER